MAPISAAIHAIFFLNFLSFHLERQYSEIDRISCFCLVGSFFASCFHRTWLVSPMNCAHSVRKTFPWDKIFRAGCKVRVFFWENKSFLKILKTYSSRRIQDIISCLMISSRNATKCLYIFNFPTVHFCGKIKFCWFHWET